MKKIVSFGDSFIFGSELQNNIDGSKGWPGLAAKALGYEYETRAIPGCGNDAICRQILEYFAHNPSQDTLAVINWTWALRWDFYTVSQERWTTVGPTCVPMTLAQFVTPGEADRILQFYHDYTGNSSVWEKWRSLNSIYTAQKYLDSRQIKTIETFIDPEIVDDSQHCPSYIKELQSQVKSRLTNFDGMSFLDWSRHKGFTITPTRLHPLEDAHQSAAEFWRDTYARALA